MPTRRPYSTDLSDEEWEILRPLVPEAKPGGRPPAHRTREILNAIFYVLRGGCAWRLRLEAAPGGCAWRLLPHDFLPWQSAYHYFRAWRMDGTWERIHATLRQRLRRLLGIESLPQARRSSTPRGPRPPRGADCAATMVARRSTVESGICSLTRKVW
jgi:putative transposase